jgi:hypothetical protein
MEHEMTDSIENMSLFEDQEIIEAPPLLYPTNQMNLQEILSTGMIKPHQGYPRDKHYQDLLNLCPGRVPLFIDRIPAQALSIVTREGDYLEAVVLELASDRLAGSEAIALNDAGRGSTIGMEAALNQRPVAVLVDGVLPVSLVRGISFASAAAKKRFLTTIADTANVRVEAVPLKVRRSLYSVQNTFDLEQLGDVEAPLMSVQWKDHLLTEAWGGVLAHLLLSGQPESPARTLAEAAFAQPPREPEPTMSLPRAICTLPAWLRGDQLPDSASVESRVLWALLDKLATKQHKDEPPTRGLIRLLDEMAENLEEHLRTPLKERARRIQQMTGLGDESPEEFFKSSKSVLGGLLLFLLCKDSKNLSSPEPGGWAVGEPTLLVARLLCGAWEGWTELPASLRGGEEVQRAVTHAMAALHNRRYKSGINLGEPLPLPEPPRPQLSLVQLFKRADWENRTVKKAALELCRKMKWSCLQTIITLPRGHHRFEVGGGSPRIVIDGDVKLSHEVIREPFLERLETEEVPPQHETVLRDALER